MKAFQKSLVGFGALLMMSATSVAADFGGKKVLFIDSYHEGYPWSDGITAGVKEVIGASGAELKIHRMDTKRNSSTEFKEKAALEAKALIESYKPDVVVACDDNASKFLIAPYYKGKDLPFVFCGVNWDASGYGFPAKNVTGMVEVNALGELLDVLKPIAGGEKVAFLVGDVATSHKEAANIKKVFGLEFAEEVYAKTFADWKKAYTDLQGKADILIVANRAGIKNWNDEDAIAFVEANTKIVTGSLYEFMGPLAMITYGKVAEEQGSWAANAALKILGGTSPADIAIAKNKEGKLIINAKIVEAVGAEIPSDLVESADLIIE